MAQNEQAALLWSGINVYLCRHRRDELKVSSCSREGIVGYRHRVVELGSERCSSARPSDCPRNLSCFATRMLQRR